MTSVIYRCLTLMSRYSVYMRDFLTDKSWRNSRKPEHVITVRELYDFSYRAHFIILSKTERWLSTAVHVV